jgi:hypothetical protein
MQTLIREKTAYMNNYSMQVLSHWHISLSDAQIIPMLVGVRVYLGGGGDRGHVA